MPAASRAAALLHVAFYSIKLKKIWVAKNCEHAWRYGGRLKLAPRIVCANLFFLHLSFARIIPRYSCRCSNTSGKCTIRKIQRPGRPCRFIYAISTFIHTQTERKRKKKQIESAKYNLFAREILAES